MPILARHLMNFTKNIEEEIHSQIIAGFTIHEIRQNLRLKGNSEAEIDDAFGKVNFEQVAAISSSGQGTSAKSIILGILFVLLILFKIGRVASHGAGWLLVISIIVGIIGIVSYFVRRR